MSKNETHGSLLLSFIQNLEQANVKALSEGGVVLVDGVELARYLRALVEHKPQHEVDTANATTRLQRVRAGAAGFLMCVPFHGWRTRKPGD